MSIQKMQHQACAPPFNQLCHFRSVLSSKPRFFLCKLGMLIATLHNFHLKWKELCTVVCWSIFTNGFPGAGCRSTVFAYFHRANTPVSGSVKLPMWTLCAAEKTRAVAHRHRGPPPYRSADTDNRKSRDNGKLQTNNQKAITCQFSLPLLLIQVIRF